MIKGLKICGVSDSKTLNYILNHPHPPKFIGFITNYEKSKRFVEYEKLKNLIIKTETLSSTQHMVLVKSWEQKQAKLLEQKFN